MTPGEIATIMRALGRLEGKVDQLAGDHEDLRGEVANVAANVETLNAASLIAKTLAESRGRFWTRVCAIILGLATVTSGGTGIIVYVANTTHPAHDTTRTIVKSP